MKLPSLERLEAMNRRAVNLAFPPLTVGLLISAALLFRDFDRLEGYKDPCASSVLPVCGSSSP